MLETVEQWLEIQLLTLSHNRHAAGSGFVPANDASGSAAVEQFEESLQLFTQIGRRVMPWVTWPEIIGSKLTEENLGKLIDVWQQVFGRLDSPAVQAKLKALEQKNAGKPMLWLQQET